ncbi:SDR family oxidoreductase [Nanoarchaeota archaeon]
MKCILQDKMTKILLLGYTGKMGIALNKILKEDYEIICKNSQDFDASNFEQVKKMVKELQPDILINTVAFHGIDPCEKEPEKALAINTLHTKLLAELSNEMNFLLVHFSTDAIFNNQKDKSYVESDTPKPINLYGFTKYGADCFIQAIAKKYYIVRYSLLFGENPRNNQLIEKMTQKIKEGEEIGMADDITCSPSYSIDIAKEVKRMLKSSLPYGIYHIVNEGKATLYEIMVEVSKNLKVDTSIKKASFRDFNHLAMKNTDTLLTSEKINALRPWKEAIKDYVFEEFISKGN